MCGRATLTTVASSVAIPLAATVATRARRPRPEASTSCSSGGATSSIATERRSSHRPGRPTGQRSKTPPFVQIRPGYLNPSSQQTPGRSHAFDARTLVPPGSPAIRRRWAVPVTRCLLSPSVAPSGMASARKQMGTECRDRTTAQGRFERAQNGMAVPLKSSSRRRRLGDVGTALSVATPSTTDRHGLGCSASRAKETASHRGRAEGR